MSSQPSLAAVEHDNVLRQALEKILQPTTSTTEKIVRCASLQEDLQKKITALTENLHKVSAECAERSGRIPQQLDAHVQWVKQARVRAGNVRKSLEGTKSRLQTVLVHLERLAANEEDHAKRTEAQMNSIVEALEKQSGNNSISSINNNNNSANVSFSTAIASSSSSKNEEKKSSVSPIPVAIVEKPKVEEVPEEKKEEVVVASTAVSEEEKKVDEEEKTEVTEAKEQEEGEKKEEAETEEDTSSATTSAAAADTKPKGGKKKGGKK